VPIIALLCTQSVGALAVFAVAVIALGVKQVRAGTIKRVHAVVALLAVPDEHAGKRLAFLRGRCGKALGWAVVALSIVAALAGVYLDTQMGALQDAAAHADGARASKLLESTPSMKGDVASLEVAATAYLTGGDYAAVVELAGDAGRSSGVLSLQRLIALVKLHEDAAALTEMTGLLHGSPYDVELYGAVRQLIVEGGLDDRFADAYNAEAARANELAASGHAAWLANAETIDALP